MKKSVKRSKGNISKVHDKAHKTQKKAQIVKKRSAKPHVKSISSLKIPSPPAPKFDTDKETLKYLKMAFELEKKALHFYMDTRNHTTDFNMKTFLNTLLDLEINHFNTVGRVKRLYEQKKTADVKREADKFVVHKPVNPFKGLKQWDKLDKQEHGIYTIFNTALTMESAAYHFYIEAAQHAKGEFIKEFLQKLAKDEWYHKEFISSHKEATYNNGYWLGIDHVRIEG